MIVKVRARLSMALSLYQARTLVPNLLTLSAVDVGVRRVVRMTLRAMRLCSSTHSSIVSWRRASVDSQTLAVRAVARLRDPRSA